MTPATARLRQAQARLSADLAEISAGKAFRPSDIARAAPAPLREPENDAAPTFSLAAGLH